MNKLSLSKNWTIAVVTFVCCQVGQAQTAKPTPAAKPGAARTTSRARPVTSPAVDANTSSLAAIMAAQNRPNSEPLPVACTGADTLQKIGATEEDLAKLKETCIEAIRAKSTKDVSASCVEASKDFKSARDELDADCGRAPVLNKIIDAMGAKGEERPLGSACITNLVRCDQCASRESAEFGGQQISCGKWEDISTDDRDSDGERPRNSPATSSGSGSAMTSMLSSFMSGASSSPVTSGMSPKELREEIGTCIPLAAEELSDMHKDVKDSKATAEKLRDRVLKRNEELMKERQDTTDGQSRRTDQEEALRQKANDEITRLKEGLDNADQEATRVFTERMMATENEISQLEMAKVAAQTAENNAVNTLNQGCHMSALKIAEDERQRILTLISQNAYTAGGFNDMMAQTGKSTATDLQNVANKAYNACISDRAYAMAKQASISQKSLVIQQTNDQIAKRRTLLTTNRTEFLKGKTLQNQQTLTKITQVSQRLDTALNVIRRESSNDGSKAAQRQMLAMTEVGMLNRQLQDSESELSYQSDKARLIRRLTGGRGAKEGSVSEALKSFKKAERQAEDVVRLCCNKSSALESEVSQACGQANFFLNGKKGDEPTVAPATDKGSSSSSTRSTR